MCGIVGLISRDQVDTGKICSMIESIRHRGPDDYGYFVEKNVGLGQARLNIIDLENGKQPIFNEDESLVVIFNGEIFNYQYLTKDLLEKGHIFKTRCDTEVIPHMYEEYGEKMFTKLNGQFAIAIWDRRTKKLILARDRVGEKPLFYHYDHHTICFSSEIKGIFKSESIKPKLSAKALGHYFTYWGFLDTETIFEGVNALAPGHYLIFQDGKIEINEYWKFTYSNISNKKTRTIDQYIEEIEKYMISAVERRLIADVPVACYLSGGLDSSLITAIAAQKYGKRLNTFSITFNENEYNESKFQDIVAQRFATEHHKMLYRVHDGTKLVRDIVRHIEQPFTRPSIFPLYNLAQFVKGLDLKVVLSGEGSDELFGGYTNYKIAKLRSFYKRHPRFNNILIPLLKMYGTDIDLNANDLQIKNSRKISGFTSILNYDIQRKITNDSQEQLLTDFGAVDFFDWSPLRSAQYFDFKTLLTGYTLCSEGDRITMASGVECRYPFLDPEVVEFAITLPDSLKLRGLNEKYILKKVASKYLPEEIVNRKKFAFYAPFDISNIINDEVLANYLSTEKIDQFGIFDSTEIEKIKIMMQYDINFQQRTWWYFLAILTTQVLYDEFINKAT